MGPDCPTTVCAADEDIKKELSSLGLTCMSLEGKHEVSLAEDLQLEASALLPKPSPGMTALPHVGVYLVAGYERS